MLRLLVTVCFACFGITSAQAAEMLPVRSVTVTAQAERKLVPDEAHLTVNLNALAPKLADAKAAQDAKLTRLMGLLKQAGIPEKKVQTQSSSTAPDYRYDETGSHLRGYRAQTVLDVTVTPLDKVGPLMEAITQAGFEKGGAPEWGNLLSLSYGLSDPQTLQDTLLEEAITKARAKADRMADAADARLGKVLTLQEGGVSPIAFPQPVMMMKARPMGAEMASDAVAPPAGESTVTASVTATFELE